MILHNRLNKNKLIALIIISSTLLLSACTKPTSKEEYIVKFESFVDKVNENYNDYKKKDWEYADRRFEKFSKEWYDEFKDDLSLKEQIKVGGLKIKYQSFKGGNKLKQFYNDVLKEDVDEIREKVKFYIENDMDEDLEKLIEGAEEICDSLLNVVKGIVEEIDEEL